MIKAEKVTEVFKEMLESNGFNYKDPNPLLVWEAYKEFSKIKVDCTDDELFFECGVFDFTGQEFFYFEFKRQFSYENENGEYDHMEQFRVTIFYPPNNELRNLQRIEWATSFDSNDDYFKYIQRLKAFTIPIEKYDPENVEIYWGRV